MTTRHDDQSEVLVQIAEARARWVSAINRGDVDGFVSTVTEDAVWAAPRTEPLSGRTAIREWLREPFGRFDYEYRVISVQIHATGGWALERSDFESAVTDGTGGPPRVHRGTYTMVWRQTGAGWLIERYVDESLLVAG